MADQSHEQTGKRPRPPLWLDRRVWSLLVALAIGVTYLSDSKGTLKYAEQVSYGAAGYIDKYFTPGSFLSAFEERVGECDYHWLFICEAPPKQVCEPGGPYQALLCPPAKDDHFILDPDRYRLGNAGLIGEFWSGILILGALPDATWYVIEKDYQTGWGTLALLFVFLGINIAVATRAPLAAFPIALPGTVAISSGLFWLLGQFLVLTANGVGTFFWFLVIIASLPSLIVVGLGWVVNAHSFQDFVHEVRTALGLVKEIKRQ